MTNSAFTHSLLRASQFVPDALEPPDAWVGHLPFASWLVAQFRPEQFVELGTHTGNSFFSFCQAIQQCGLSSRAYAIDTWEGDEHAGYYGDAVYAQVHAYNAEHYAGFARLLRMTFDAGLEYFADQSIDLLHIDGLHTYDAVKHDFESWLPKLRPGAVVLFHDTNVREQGFAVWKLWDELAVGYPSFEFIHSHGLGVLQIDGGPPERRLAWLSADDASKQDLRDYFAALGACCLDAFALKQLKRNYQDLIAAHEGLQQLHEQALEQAHDREVLQEAVLKEHQTYIQNILASKSWKITAPLRAVTGMFRFGKKKSN